MDNLWKTRLNHHQKEQMKYLRLVLNDNFVIALFFLLGGVMYGYSNLIKTLNQSTWWTVPVAIVIMTAALSVGRLATLLEPADAVFLLPKEGEFAKFFVKARRYSIIVPFFSLIVISGCLTPLLLVTTKLSILGIIGLTISLLFLKDILLWLNMMWLYTPVYRPVYARKSIFYLIAVVLMTSGFYVTPLIPLLASLLLDVFVRIQITNVLVQGGLEWNDAIEREQSRMFQLYRFYNLFTDVPGMQSQIHRRKWLDWLLPFVRPTQSNTFDYLYLRGFLRGSEYSGLFVRLLIIGAALIAFITNVWLSMLILVMFIYLVGFQLLPFYKQFDGIVFTHLYPVSVEQKRKAFKRMFTNILSIQLILMVIPSLLVLKTPLESLILLVGGALMVVLYALWYLPIRLKKIEARF